jgi:hypothetical protein
LVTAQQQTMTITKSGVAPGNESLARKVGWKTTARKIVEINAMYLYIFINFDSDSELGKPLLQELGKPLLQELGWE